MFFKSSFPSYLSCALKLVPKLLIASLLQNKSKYKIIRLYNFITLLHMCCKLEEFKTCYDII